MKKEMFIVYSQCYRLSLVVVMVTSHSVLPQQKKSIYHTTSRIFSHDHMISSFSWKKKLYCLKTMDSMILEYLPLRMHDKICLLNAFSTLRGTCRDEYDNNVQRCPYTKQARFFMIVAWYTKIIVRRRNKLLLKILRAPYSPPSAISFPIFVVMMVMRRTESLNIEKCLGFIYAAFHHPAGCSTPQSTACVSERYRNIAYQVSVMMKYSWSHDFAFF